MSRIDVDTNTLREYAAKIRKSSGTLKLLRNRIERLLQNADLKEKQSLQQANNLLRDLPRLERSAQYLNRTAEDFERTEAFIKKHIKQGGCTGSTVNKRSAEAAATVASAKMKAKKRTARDFESWATRPGSIAPLEYSILCKISYCKSSEEARKMLNQYFPEGHPLHGLRQSQISGMAVGQTQAIVIRLDEKTAFVVFQGTNMDRDSQDVLADSAIAMEYTPNSIKKSLRNAPQIALDEQVNNAEDIIITLEKAGYTNIKTSGHSLGGYLAAYTAFSHPSVTECTTFDAPGFNKYYAREINQRGLATKVTNYSIFGSIVNTPGRHIGKEQYIRMDPNYDNSAGPLPYHGIDGICHALGWEHAEELLMYER